VGKKVLEIAEFLKAAVIGDKDVVIRDIKGIDEAGEGDLTFIANPRYRKKIESTRASAILVSPDIKKSAKTLIVVDDPYASLAKLLAWFYPPREEAAEGISSLAFIEKEAFIAEDAVIYPFVSVGRKARIESGAVLHPGVAVGREAVIGEQSVLYPNVTVYPRCLIGKRVILHAGVVVGSDGFGYANPGRENLKVPQVGIVQIDDDVEVGANTTIDRGTLGKTWIKRGVKIDNHVQIAHNVVIGENSIIVSMVGISGSTKLGRSVVLGGQAGLVGHITLGDGVMVAARSGVAKDVPSGQIVSGAPAVPHGEWLRIQAIISKLPEMRSTMLSLSKKIEELEERRKAKG
jgi:UDP-3-O-[3-hydroxymyristoyl] glucosamine N-acyltransferase